MALPGLPVTLPPATPYTGGLYDAATLVDDIEARHLGGVIATDPNQGAHGVWLVPEPEGGNEPKEGAEHEEPQHFPGLVAWAADTAKTVGWTEQDALARAEHLLSLYEQPQVEQFVATQLVADGQEYVPAPGAEWPEVVGALEAALARRGFVGVLHADRKHLARAEKEGVVKRQGGRLLAPGGNAWAFGAGYGGLGDTVVATGAVLVRRSAVTSGATLQRENNQRMAMAERVVTPYWAGPQLFATLGA